MYLFMLLLLPLILAAWCFYKKDSHLIPVIVTGIVAAVLVCGFKAFFLYSHRIIPYSFERNVLYLLVRQTLLLYTSFPLFVKPVLFVVMIFSLGLSAKHIEKTLKNKKIFFAVIWILIGLVSVVIPSLLEGMYILDMNYLLVLVLSAVYSAFLPVLFILSRFGVLTVK